MISNSRPELGPDSITIELNTFDEAKTLRLITLPPSPYNSDFNFLLEVASLSVRATDRFQVSVIRIEQFLQACEATLEGELEDENGHGSIRFEKVDEIGHVGVAIKVGGPWSDQAQIQFVTDQTAVTSFVEELRAVAESQR